jgi:hypothetical protein
MGDNNTTSIHDLPTDPVSGGSIGGNISLVANEIRQHQQQQQQQPQGSSALSLDQTTISQIVNGLQQASIAGATTLPSRDIPQNTQSLTHDSHIQANYVPPPSNNDYINDADYDNDNNINNYNRGEQMKNSLDSVYDEIQIPLLISILYFMFQLPIIRKTLCKYIPLLCNSDGNYNINGLIFTCGLFGLLYYFLSKTMKTFNTF